jgi:hypothetical protein
LSLLLLNKPQLNQLENHNELAEILREQRTTERRLEVRIELPSTLAYPKSFIEETSLQNPGLGKTSKAIVLRRNSNRRLEWRWVTSKNEAPSSLF